MSATETRISLPFARNLAEKMVDLLRPHCDRIEIAGSIRREKETVGDIEIVMIPKAEFNLLGEAYRTDAKIERALHDDGFSLLKNGEHYKQAVLPGGTVRYDLFLTTPEKWAVIFTIRTGSAEFAHRLVTRRNRGGLCPSWMTVQDGRLWDGQGNMIDAPEEADLFRAMGLEWIEPKERV